MLIAAVILKAILLKTEGGGASTDPIKLFSDLPQLSVSFIVPDGRRAFVQKKVDVSSFALQIHIEYRQFLGPQNEASTIFKNKNGFLHINLDFFTYILTKCNFQHLSQKELQNCKS